MIRNYLTILFLLFLCLAEPGVAQTSGSKNKKDVIELLTKAKEQMAAEDYVAANQSFREMLELKAVLPSEMCYFFANTLYHLKQYENSLRFAEKYESLTGNGGEFYQETLQLKQLLKNEMEAIRKCNFCDNQGYVLEKCHYCEGAGETKQSCLKCYGHKEHKCKICSGEGVVIQKNHFGQRNYQTCQSCKGSGIEECSYCQGKGELTQNCQYCSGSGKIRNNQLCSHQQEVN